MIDFNKVRFFHAVASERSFTKAAEKLNIAQSGLSRTIRELEKELGTILFERHSRGVILTAQGERLREFAEKIFQETSVFEKIFHENENDVSGTIKIVTTPFFGSEWLIPKLNNFINDFPNVRLSLSLTFDFVGLTDSDVAISTFMPNKDYLIQRPLHKSRLKLYASQSYCEKYGLPKTVKDLDQHRLLAFKENIPKPYGNPNWLLNIGLKDFTPPRTPFLEADSLHGITKAIIQGYGIGVILESLVSPEMNLINVLPESKAPELEIFYIFYKEMEKSKLINTLYDYLAKE
jgi:DNA-binding transcriptional LysR family regulator